MYKAFTISTLATIALCGTHVPYSAMYPPEASWPVLELFTTFKTDASLFTWDGKKLAPYKVFPIISQRIYYGSVIQSITATIKVDSDRNKIKVDAKVAMPLVGKINAEVLVDLSSGTAYEYVPFLGLCQKTPLGVIAQLRDVIQKIYSPDGGVTFFDGEASAPWDPATMFKFHGSGPDAVVTAYFDENTKNGKWIAEIPTDPSNPSLVASILLNRIFLFLSIFFIEIIPNGEQQASFTDADFQIKGCATYTTENLVNIWVRLLPIGMLGCMVYPDQFWYRRVRNREGEGILLL